MKIYAIRQAWDYEIYDLIEFFLRKEDAEGRAQELNKDRRPGCESYAVEEWEAKG